MDNPQNNKLTLGTQYATFSESQLNTEKAIENVTNSISETNTKMQNYVTEQVTTLNSNIEQSAGAIRTEVLETYTSKSELNEYKESVSTQFTQTNNDFTFTFQRASAVYRQCGRIRKRSSRKFANSSNFWTGTSFWEKLGIH